AFADLSKGNLTAPTLFAMEETPYLRELIERQLEEPGDLEEAITLVQNSQGIPKARALAEKYAKTAAEMLEDLPNSDARQALLELTNYTLKRLY
ncbi:MAG: solanesyl diphosphate synthase, partial [Cyanobacteria bacterium P01_F01_bin.42]